MKKMYLFIAVLLIGCLTTLNSFGQISQGGKPQSFNSKLSAGLNKSIAFKTMPSVDVALLRSEDVINDQSKEAPWRFGQNIAVDFNLDNSGTWDVLPNGDKMWRLGIYSPAALTINLTFDQYILPPGAKLFVYNADKTHVIGAFTDFNNQADEVFATTLVEGDALIIEYTEPATVPFPGKLNLTRVTHGYRNGFDYYQKAFGDAGSCNLNVACPAANGWDNEIRAVCMLVSGGSGFCSGTLINNTAQDGTPYVLTADHCYSNPSSWVFWFNWQSPTCANPGSSPAYNSITGASLKARNTASDFCLVQMNSTPPSGYNVYYAGWNRTTASSITGTISGIHHPSGDIKKFSYTTGGVTTTTYLQNPSPGDGTHWRITSWSGNTTTEGGSSGSSLYDSDHRIIGQLHGGYAACGNTTSDWYGKLGVSWTGGGSNTTRLSNWLDPLGTAPATLDGYDPNTPSLALDAKVNTIVTPVASYCTVQNITPAVEIKNNGTTNLSSLVVKYHIDGGADVIKNWTGNLGSGNTTQVSFTQIALTAGSHRFYASVTSPNGGSDQNTANDTLSLAYGVGGATLPFTEGFESTTFTPFLWSLNNPDAGTTWARAAIGGNNPSQYAAYFDNFNYNAAGQLDDMISRPVDLTGYSTATVTFDVAYRGYDGSHQDGMKVFISTNCGTSYNATPIYNKTGATLATGTDVTSAFIPNQAGQWRMETIDLTPYVGNNITLKFQNVCGYGNNLYVDDINITGTSGAIPVVDFSGTPTTVCVGSPVQFTDLSTNTPASWSWTFTGGTPATSTVQNPSVTYSTAGTYAVSLTATNASGSNTKTVAGYITVINPTTANFTSATTTACVGSPVQYTDLSTNSPSSWSWSFQGGTPATSTLQNPSVTYAATGSYQVILTATNGCGPNTKTVNNYMTVINPTVANFSANNTNICTGASVNFTDLSTNNPISWSWTFTGGTPAASTVQNPTVTYSVAGTYNVTLIATNGCGPNTKTMTGYITVSSAPVANFSASPTAVCSGSTVQFTDISTNTPASWNWIFTGGTPSSASVQNPLVNYNTQGTYSVSLTATNSCGNNTKTSTSLISVTNPPTVSTSSTNETLPGACDGTGTANATGGTSPYSYAWSAESLVPFGPGQTGNITKNTTTNFTLAVAGLGNLDGLAVILDNITLSITHGALNKLTSVSLVAPDNTVVTLASGLTGANLTSTKFTMSATQAITSGAAPYTGTFLPVGNFASFYNNQPADGTWRLRFVNGNQNGCSVGTWTMTFKVLQSSQNAAGLCAGTYTVTVSDANGCSNMGNVTITSSVTPLSASITASTAVSCNGGTDGSATVTAGNGTPPYTYLWSSGATTTTANNLAAGAYTVTVFDALMANATASVTLTQPAALTATTTITNVSCNGGNNGTATVTASGGILPYSYLWTGGQTTATATNLIAGTFNVTVTDANTCTKTSTVTITQPAVALSAVISSKTDVSCSGNNDGDATVTASGGTTGYTYLWTQGSVTATASSLPAGTFTITVTDNNLCTATALVTITEPASIALTVTVTDANCGSSDGSASVSVTGGTAPYSYLWSTGGTTSAISSLAAGAYTVTVTDLNGCTSSNTANISNLPSTIILTTSVTDAICGNPNGDATVTVSGGTSPYTYLWNDPPSTASATAASLAPGNYSVTVTDTDGCTATTSATVGNIASTLLVTSTATDATCGGANGSVTSVVTGGTSPYTYNWNTGCTDVTCNVAAGIYTVTVTDSNGCFDVATATVNDLASTIVLTESVTDATCGNFDGQASVGATGGTGVYTYLWNTGSVNDTIDLIPAGAYSVTVLDTDGCSASASMMVNEIGGPSLTFSTGDVTCNGDTDGWAIVSASGGVSPYTYLWSSGEMDDTTLNLTAGIIAVTVTDDNGCLAIGNVTITEPTAITVTDAITDVSCFNGNDGSVILTVAGGTLPYYYDWSSGGTSPVESNLVAGDYAVSITDDAGCTILVSVTITEPSVIDLTTGVTDAACGNSDGTASVTPTGGTGSYTYSWSTGDNTANIGMLPPGDYSVTVSDANLCQETATVTVGSISGPAVTMASTDESIPGACDGTASANATGGELPYTYNWSSSSLMPFGPGQTGVFAKNVVTNFTLPVAGLGNLDGTTLSLENITFDMVHPNLSRLNSVSLVAPDNTTIPLVSGGVSGTNMTNTQFTMSASGSISGAAPYTGIYLPVGDFASFYNGQPADGTWNLQIDNGNQNGCSLAVWTMTFKVILATQSASGLCAGTYYVTVTDNNGCTIADSALVQSPGAGVSASIVSFSDVTCNGGTEGIATVAATGGSSPYTYLWTGGQTTATATNLAQGIYTVTVTDAALTTSTAVVTITEPEALSINIITSEVSCFGGNDGTAAATVTGGTLPYYYLWTGGQTTATATSLTSGTITVTVTDANVCTTTNAALVSEPVSLTASISASENIGCYGGNDGAATVVATGGTAPYVYLWNDGQTTATASNLSQGTFVVSVTDGNGCIVNTAVTLTEPAILTAVISNSTNVYCNGANNGSATVFASGGTTPYSYLWNDPATTTIATATNLPVGTFNATATDANGCEVYASVTLTEPAAMVTTVTVTDATCGNSDGSASVIVTGGTGLYSYLWSDGGTTESITDIASGVYSVTVTDENNCTAEAFANVNNTGGPALDVTSYDVTCFGGADGFATVTPTGGSSPYTYIWSSGGNGATELDMTAGSYAVSVIDAGGCMAAGSVLIGEPTQLLASFDLTNVSCFGGSNGDASVVISGGVTPYAVEWSTGETSAMIGNLVAGNYTVTITDMNGCVLSDAVQITEPVALAITSSSTDATCGNTDGSVSVTVTGGAGGYLYDWSNGGTTPSQTNLQAGIYDVIVTDANGCTVSASVSVADIGAPAITVSSINTSCYGSNDGAASVTVTGGSLPYSYLWSSGGTSNTEINLFAGIYTITVTDAGGCMTFENIAIGEAPAMTATFIQTPVSCNGLSDGVASVDVIGGTPGYSYVWSAGSATGTQIDLPAGTCSVTVTDSNGCIFTGDVTITEPDVITSSISSVDANCGMADGSATVSASGGTPGYSYLWSDGQTTATVLNLAAGIYDVTITDSNGCTDLNTAIITNVSSGLVTISAFNNVSCFGSCDGYAIASMTGGTAPYTYVWSNSATMNFNLNLCNGVYSVSATDANGCIASASVTITEPSQLSVSYTITDVTTIGGSDGAIDLTVTGGVSPYNYSWSTGDITQNLSGLTTGIYSVTVSDSNGCLFSFTDTVNEPGNLIVNPAILSTVSIYPNPNKGIFMLKLVSEDNGPVQVKVTGVDGKTVYVKEFSKESAEIIQSFDLRTLVSGFYHIQLITNKGLINKMVIIE